MSEEREREHARMVGAVIAAEVAAEMAPPLGELRDRLGLIVRVTFEIGADGWERPYE